MGRALDSFMRGFGRSFSPGITEGANLGRAMLAKREQQKRSSRLLGEKIAREEAKEERRRYEWREGRTDRTAAAGTKAKAVLTAKKTSDSLNSNISPAAFRAAHGIKPGSQMAIASEAAQAAAKVKAATGRGHDRGLVRLRASEGAGHRKKAANQAAIVAEDLLRLRASLDTSGVDRVGKAEVESNRKMVDMVLLAAKRALSKGTDTGGSKHAAMRVVSAARKIARIRTIGSGIKIPRSLLNEINKHGKKAFGVGSAGGDVVEWLGLHDIPANMIDETR